MGHLLRLLATRNLPVTRHIASNGRGPGAGSGSVSNGTNTTSNMRSSQFNESGVALTNLALIYAGWYTDTTNETDLPNAYTVSASIEYPAGTYTQVTWAGATSTSITAGQNIVSDFVTVNIPANTQFWVRSFVSVTAGQVWHKSHVLDTARGEACEEGVGLSDKTMSGTITGATQGFRPSAMISKGMGFRKVSLGVIGDSITFGSGDGAFDARSNTSWIGRAASSNCPIINCSVSGTQLGNQVAAGKLSRRLDLFAKAGITHVIIDWGANDVASVGLGTLQTNASHVIGQVNAAGMKAVYTTITPKTTSTDKYYTTANQTPATGYTGGASSVRSQFNDWLRGLPSSLYACIENADILETARDSCIWKAGNTQTGYLAANTDSWTVGEGSTTTVFTSNSTQPANYYNFGSVLFTSGALNGTFVTSVTSQTAGGSFTVPTLASAPASGDTFKAYPFSAASTTDGLHPNVSSLSYGGHIILKENFVPILQAWNA